MKLKKLRSFLKLKERIYIYTHTHLCWRCLLKLKELRSFLKLKERIYIHTHICAGGAS